MGKIWKKQTEAPQPVHFDAAERCLYTAFVALQDVTYEMGPTHFWPGFVCCFAMDSWLNVDKLDQVQVKEGCDSQGSRFQWSEFCADRNQHSIIGLRLCPVGTNTVVAHRHFESDPQGYLDTLQPAAPLLKAGLAWSHDRERWRENQVD